jgi:hypothetical protein
VSCNMLYCYLQMCEMNGWAFFHAVLEKMIFPPSAPNFIKDP